MLRNALRLAYAGLAYVLALGAIAYLVGFLSGHLVPKGINDGTPGDPWVSAAVNLALVTAFGLHHSATARRRFKAWWTRIVPPDLERATYLHMTVAATALLVWLWQPIPVTVWHVASPVPAAAILALYLAVWGMMFAATFHIGHFGFFGLAQVWDRVHGKRPEPAPFCARWLYAVVRHPISLGWMLVPWLTPHMTAGQLVFAAGITAYVLAATVFEEADLAAELGETYHAYRARVPAFLPRIG